MKNIIFNIQRVFFALSRGEKFLVCILGLIFVISTVTLLTDIEKYYTSIKPQRGGSFTEGIIGVPRFINPVIAETDADRDLTTLVYSGLMRLNENGGTDLDLAESYSISDDGLTYTFKLKENIVFHDGSKITTEDILYTIQTIKDPLIKSPKRINWEGVEVEAINEKEIIFRLDKPYGSFLYQTTIGIVPAKLWRNVPVDDFRFSFLNNDPIGSGPYKLLSVKKPKGNELSTFELSSFKQFALGEAYINQITIKSYKDEMALLEAYKNKEIDSMIGISNKEARSIQIDGIKVIEKPLPRIFAVFLNSNKNALLGDKNIRKALSESINRQDLISSYLFGFASETYDTYPDNDIRSEISNKSADEIMSSAGWLKDEFGKWYKKQKTGTSSADIILSVANSPSDLKDIANSVAKTWNDFGFNVSVEEQGQTELIQQKIRPRSFEALLFGMIINHESDLFAFWHSSQRIDPGLNVSGYANIKTDAILEKLRIEGSAEQKKVLLEQFDEIIEAEVPAVFLFIPNEVYVPAGFVKNVVIPSLTISADRFALIHKWHIEEKKEIDFKKLFIKS